MMVGLNVFAIRVCQLGYRLCERIEGAGPRREGESYAKRGAMAWLGLLENRERCSWAAEGLWLGLL